LSISLASKVEMCDKGTSKGSKWMTKTSQRQQTRRIRREEEFRDLEAAANLRRVGYYQAAKALVAHSRAWRLYQG
jgi:hypothetical protein